MRSREYRPIEAYPNHASGPHRAAIPGSGIPDSSVLLASNAWHADRQRLVAEIDRLRRALAKQESDSNRQIQSTRESERRRSIEFKQKAEAFVTKLQTETSDVKSKLTSIEQSHAESTRKHESEIAEFKRELQNTAAAAAEEQRVSSERLERERSVHRSELSRLADLLKSQEKRARKESGQRESLTQQQSQWKRSHAAAVELATTLEQLGLHYREEADHLRESYDNLANDYESLVHEALHYQSDAEESITKLRHQTSLLESDHLDLELICESLDQCVDEKDAEIEELNHQLQGVFESSRINERYFEGRIRELRQQVDFVESQLAVSLAEKSSLTESVAKLRAEAGEFDAALFAKDQEVAATNRHRHEAQAQVDLLRRENAALQQSVSEIQESLRNQNQTLNQTLEANETSESNCKKLEGQLNELRLQNASLENDLRQFETSARAAEANAILQASEAEQAHFVQLEALESELAQQKALNKANLEEHQRDQRSQQERIARLESAVSLSESEANEFREQFDRLRHELETAQGERRELEKQRVESEDAQRSGSEEQDRQRQVIAALRSEVEQAERRVVIVEKQLGESNSEIERLQREGNLEARHEKAANENGETSDVDEDGIWPRRLGELQQQLITQRERDHQNVLKLQEKLQEREEQLAKAQASYSHLTEEHVEKCEILERALQELEETRLDDPPKQEVKRLSRELADQLAEASREREALLSRIAELHERRRLRAA